MKDSLQVRHSPVLRRYEDAVVADSARSEYHQAG